MSFDLKHLPRCFGDLVIADPLNASVICSYCELPPAKPLLLAGPPGAGKTEAARVIAHSYFEQRNIQHMHWEFNAASLGKDYEAKIMSEVNYQMFGNLDKALIVINEIDEMDLRSSATQVPRVYGRQASSDPLCSHHQPQEPHHGSRPQQVPRG